MENHTTEVLCTICLKHTDHKVDIDRNNEANLTCLECEHLLKFPANADVMALIKDHEAHNLKQVVDNVERARAIKALHDNLGLNKKN